MVVSSQELLVLVCVSVKYACSVVFGVHALVLSVRVLVLIVLVLSVLVLSVLVLSVLVLSVRVLVLVLGICVCVVILDVCSLCLFTGAISLHVSQSFLPVIGAPVIFTSPLASTTCAQLLPVCPYKLQIGHCPI